MRNLMGEAIDGHADEAAAKRGLAREALLEATAGRVHERERKNTLMFVDRTIMQPSDDRFYQAVRFAGSSRSLKALERHR
jgi:hypothetical protein